MKFYPHHIGDYRSATSYLSNEEDICYRRLIDIYYDTEQPLQNDPRILSRQTSVSHAVVEDILREFFVLIDGFWHNSRADEEIAGWYERSAKAKASVAAREVKRAAGAAVVRSNVNQPIIERSSSDHRAIIAEASTQDPRPKTQELKAKDYVDAEASSAVAVAPSPVDGLQCQHQKIVDLFHTKRPDLPQVLTWNDTRKRLLKSLWCHVVKQNNLKTTEEVLEYFGNYFDFVGQSDFLCGRAKTNGDRKPFLADLEWIIRQANFTKIIEGKYHA